VSDDAKPLFLIDPGRFWGLVTNDDSQVRYAAFDTIDDLLICEIVRYGVFNKPEMAGPLATLYREQFMQIPEERRLGVYLQIAGFVEHTSVSINAFLPFVTQEGARPIVATAVIDYASFGPLTDGDPMSRVKDIIEMIEEGRLRNEGAAFGALLHIGDKRACDLLLPLRDSLDNAALKEAVNCGTGFVHSSTVEFYLDWLEGLEGDDQDVTFSQVVAGLGNLMRVRQADQIFTGERPFPTRGVSRERWTELQKPVPLAEYVQGISRRMYALERAEPPPRIIPHMLAKWGLKPLTDPAETAVLDDFTATAPAHLGAEGIPGGRIVDVQGEWWEGEGNIFLVWGILDMNGPTLFVLGSREFDGEHRTFMRWLHMLGGCTTYAADRRAQITYQGIYDDAVSINEHLVQSREHGIFQTIPCFLIVNAGDESLVAIARDLLMGSEAAKGDWGRPMAYTRAFGSNFFARRGAEMREACDSLLAEARSKGEDSSDLAKAIDIMYRHIPDFENARIPPWKEMPMTPELVEEWWQIVSAFQVAALSTLRTMWEGASRKHSDEARAGLVPPDSPSRLVPWDSVIRFVVDYGLVLPR
jgi:hypothetical protein